MRIRQNMQNIYSYIRTAIVYVKITKNRQSFMSFLLKNIQKTHTKTFTPGQNMVYLYQTVEGFFFVQKLYKTEQKRRRESAYVEEE